MDELRTAPFEALQELLELVERMLDAAGHEEHPQGAVLERDVDVIVERARDALRRYEAGLPVGKDDAFQAAAELRGLYLSLLGRPEPETGWDLHRPDRSPDGSTE